MIADRFPRELLERPNWVNWRSEVRDGRRTKVPYQVDGRKASSTDPATWTTFEAVVRAFAESERFTGIGRVFSPNDPYAGVDLDKVIDPATGEINERALSLIEALNSYTEYSPSGTGTHTFVKATLPDDSRKRAGGIECYDSGRYFTVTGRQFGSAPDTIAEWDGAQLQRLLFPNVLDERPRITLTPVRLPGGLPLSDRQVFDLAAGASNGAKFRDLWNGGFGGHSSQSEADSALCWLLAFWTNRNPAQMDSLFRQSGLFRPKWDQRRGAQTYGELTVRRACERDGEMFSVRRAS